ncbi:MAG: phosphoribosylformylglycinamidine cyclo-ligase [Candidatus Cloacimonetes bacterium]|nr:phosphoribosylformylglycinamidine cyclo-ligase [Candidatus Cloacimonadota bacterium]
MEKSGAKQSGRDIDLGNKCSSNAFRWAQKSFLNRKGKDGEPLAGLEGAFSNVLNFRGRQFGISSDGIGTKVEIAERTGIYESLGHDLVAMVVDDLAANGFEATDVSNILDVDYLDYDIVDKLMGGLWEAAETAGVAISGGEIAELGSRVRGYGDAMHFNWCATAIGVLPDNLKKPVNGRGITPGDIILLLKEKGMRSNGFSLARKILEKELGKTWHQQGYNSQKTWGQMLLIPSQIMCRIITGMINAGLIPKGMAHITGGGIPDNLGRILKMNGCGAILDHLFEPPDFVVQLQQMGGIPEKEAYRIWNMGNAFIIVADNDDIDRIMKYFILHNCMIRIAGKIDPTGKIKLSSRGAFPDELVY